MRSTNDPIEGIKHNLTKWGVADEAELKAIQKDAQKKVDEEVKEAEAMAVPENKPEILFEDVYVKGSEPDFLRGRIPEENFYFTEADLGKPSKRVQERGV
jgi:pyruvate dehydrogenase E1 component alpha subunit